MDDPNILARLVERNETISLTSGTYQEITTISDALGTLFKFKKNALSEWKSVPLVSKQKKVTGLMQSFSRLYDVDKDVFSFTTAAERHTLDVAEVLSRPCDIWDKKSDLTQLDVVNVINMVIDKVIHI